MISGELLFDEEKHEYSLRQQNGNEISMPSVSRIMQSAGIYNYAKNPWNTSRMNFGSDVHKATELVDRHVGDNPYEALALFSNSDAIPLVDHYLNFRRDSKVEFELVEHRMYHPTHLFAGTIDRYGTIELENGEKVKALIDIKTGTPHPGVKIQLAAYKELLTSNSYPVDVCIALYLHQNGYTPTYFSLKFVDWSVFLCALTVHRWKEKNLGQSLKEGG